MDNFIVSARKYRPATFVSVVGQAHITSTLKNAITRGQLAHAYLFCGPRGVGKTTCARIFAKAINCLNPAEGEACNECESCRAFNEGRSFNIHELDAASNNSVDDIRNLTDQVRIPPQIGRYSIYIIDEVHMLSLSAFNAFLKTLEEPPAHAVFILATTEKHKIIPTILSRCQIYDFNRIRVEDTVGYLKYIAGEENVSHDEESLHIIARKSDGGMRDALSMFDKVVSFCGNSLAGKQVAETLNVLDYETYFKATDMMLDGNYSDLLVLFDSVLRKGFGAQIFVGGLNEHMRSLLMCKDPRTLPLLEVTGSIAQDYLNQAAKCSVPMLFEAVNLLTSVESGYRTAANQRLHVELGLMKLCGMNQKKKVADSSQAEDDLTLPTLPEPVTNSTPAAKTIEKTATASIGTHTAGESIPTVVPVNTPAAGQSQAFVDLEKSSGEIKDNTPAVTEQLSHPRQETADHEKPRPAAKPGPAVNNGGSVTGFSLKSLINGDAAAISGQEEAEQEENTLSEEERDDPNVEHKLAKACISLAKELESHRPRLSTALNGVAVTDNMLLFRVSNDTLKEEIERNMLDLKKRLSELGGLKTAIEFVIEVVVDNSVAKPYKPEDKLIHLTEKNPSLTELRKILNLEIE